MAQVILSNGGSQATPAAGNVTVYSKTDKNLYLKDDSGLESLVIFSSAGDVRYSGVISSIRNGKMSITAASATATFTADEVVVETALGGSPRRLASYNQSINLAVTGAGGMDTGTAPVSGYVALYAIYNPTTQTAALLATNATAAAVGEVYGGANMPAGYTYSALVSVWATNGSSQFAVGYQIDRRVVINNIQVLSSTAALGAIASLSLAGAVPKNAKYVLISTLYSATTGTGGFSIALSPSNPAVMTNNIGMTVSTTGIACYGISLIPLITSQTIYWSGAEAGITARTVNMSVNEYLF